MLELDIIKQHVRLEPDDDEDDALLETYSGSAARMVENHTGRTLYATASAVPKDASGNPNNPHALVLDDDISTAMLLLIGHWYANRESVVHGTTSELPMGVKALIEPYRHYFF
ncbi:head-tail connector protein [Vreelandella olivaria]|uniref:head-tail connector protein n=1 Tax=Vreelandella olivaria TaxID=390919 RepID=UPI00201E915F|nr:head-tail connector protein [Halomonas olivaria]